MSSKFPAKVAIELRSELGLSDRILDLDQLANDLGFSVSYTPIEGGAEGLSATLGSEQVILVNSEGRSAARKRFTLAHEIGHSLLDHTTACRPVDVHGNTSVPEEQAANEFAANLLMPPRLFRSDTSKLSPRMTSFDQLANLYSVSRTAAALRFLKFTHDSCAILLVGEGKNWLIKSSSAEGLRIRREIPPHYSREDLAIAASEVPADTWIENFSGRRGSVVLEEIARAGPASWLILLSELPSVEESVDPAEAEAEEELRRRRASYRRY